MPGWLSRRRRVLAHWLRDPADPDTGRPWRRGVAALAAGLFLTFMGMGFINPFIPLYLQELGIRDAAALPAWSGAVAAAGALGFAVSAPIWGLVADRFGRKPMVLRAMGLGGAATLAAAFVGSAGQLLGLRIAHGLVIGPATAAFALTSATVPQNRLLRAIGLLQVSMLVGQMIGPLLGGIAADLLGLRAALMIGGGLQMVAALLVGVLAKEHFERHPSGPGVASQPVRPASVRSLLRAPVFVAVIGGVMALQVAGPGTLPLMALYVQALGESARVSTFTGVIQAGFSAAAAFGALSVGRVTRRFSLHRVIVFGMLGAALMLVPQALAPNVWGLLVARTAQGAFIGVISPAIQTLIAQGTPPERRGTVYGLLGSASGTGSTAGPIITGFVAAGAGLSAAFMVAAGLTAAGAAWMAIRLRRLDIGRT